MKVFLFNTTICPNDGEFTLKTISLTEARALFQEADSNGWLESAIGHQTTADILSELFGAPVETNRIMAQMEPRDRSICFKLNGRPPEGKLLTLEELKEIGFSFKLLTRTN